MSQLLELLQFDSFAEFIAMDGHGIYIWISYAVVFAAMLYFGFMPDWKFRQLVRDQRSREKIAAAKQTQQEKGKTTNPHF